MTSAGARPGILAAALAAAIAAAPIPTGAGAPAAVRVVRDLPYRSVDGATLRMDLWQPAGPRRARPALLLIHGGSWRGGVKEDMDVEGRRAARAGLVAASIEYRTDAPAPAIPRQLADARAAVRFLRANAARLGVDPGRIGALGVSAGGTLAALLGTAQPAAARVRAVLSWSGPMDLLALDREAAPGLECWGRSGCGVAASLAVLVRTSVMRGGPDTELGSYMASSPLYQVSPGDQPMLLVNSVSEVIPMSQAASMASALGEAGVPRVLLRVPGSSHAGYGARVWPATLRFLQRHLVRAVQRPR
jgi:acetyl esterase/lipase